MAGPTSRKVIELRRLDSRYQLLHREVAVACDVAHRRQHLHRRNRLYPWLNSRLQQTLNQHGWLQRMPWTNTAGRRRVPRLSGRVTFPDFIRIFVDSSAAICSACGSFTMHTKTTKLQCHWYDMSVGALTSSYSAGVNRQKNENSICVSLIGKDGISVKRTGNCAARSSNVPFWVGQKCHRR